jgi:amino acid transporter
LARLGFGLAEQRLVPAPLARAHPRYGTPAFALLVLGLPLVAGGAWVIQLHLTINEIFALFGGFTVLGFLLVYELVAIASLQVALPGNTRIRQLLVGGSCVAAVSAIALAYLSSVLGQQNGMLLTFSALMLMGVVRVSRMPSALDSERMR